MKTIVFGFAAVVFFGLGMYFHDLQINRKWEICFLCLSLSAALAFEYFLHKK